MEDADVELPSADTTARYIDDQRIRAKGYTIKHRRGTSEAIWERNGVEFTQREVILREKL